jgi:hypothetical protein
LIALKSFRKFRPLGVDGLYGAIGKGEMSESEMVEAAELGVLRWSLARLRIIRLLGPA